MKEKQIVKLNENQLRQIVKESVENILKEGMNAGDEMAKIFSDEFNNECVRFLPAAWENCDGDVEAMWKMIVFYAKRAFDKAYGNGQNMQ